MCVKDVHQTHHLHMVYPDFLNWHIFCSMQPTIPMWNTLPSAKPTLAKVGFPHINAHHTNIVGWEKGSKRDIPERKTALPKGKNTLARIACYSERWNWRVLAPKKKLSQIYEPLVNMMRPTFMVSFLADSCFHFPVTSGQMRSTCFHISQFPSYCKRLLPPLVQVILCFFVLFQDLQNQQGLNVFYRIQLVVTIWISVMLVI
jgi:hypothetical protein